MFQKATKKQARLRMAIAGPSGSGKTYSALRIGTAMADRVAVIDTEHGSASKYADRFDFHTVHLGPPYSPERFIERIEAAEEEGFDLVVLDGVVLLSIKREATFGLSLDRVHSARRCGCGLCEREGPLVGVAYPGEGLLVALVLDRVERVLYNREGEHRVRRSLRVGVGAGPVKKRFAVVPVDGFHSGEGVVTA